MQRRTLIEEYERLFSKSVTNQCDLLCFRGGNQRKLIAARKESPWENFGLSEDDTGTEMMVLEKLKQKENLGRYWHHHNNYFVV